jgi:hypothetical protein
MTDPGIPPAAASQDLGQLLSLTYAAIGDLQANPVQSVPGVPTLSQLELDAALQHAEGIMNGTASPSVDLGQVNALVGDAYQIATGQASPAIAEDTAAWAHQLGGLVDAETGYTETSMEVGEWGQETAALDNAHDVLYDSEDAIWDAQSAIESY